MVELPRGTVTFLFTDIEGSTRLWQQHHAAMEAAYACHDGILRDAATTQGGVVYKTIGDAFQIAFPTAPGAVAAALEAQTALQGEDWSAHGLPAPLRVRMALHTGAVDPDPDGDYRSPVLNRLGRLLAAGHGGQVLLSQATQELSRDDLPPNTTLRDLGDRRLKDLARPERVYQLTGTGLASDFPPLRTLDARPNNLKAQPSPLVGRQAEGVAVRTLVREERVRLVTLTGPGGTGKTRLALQVAADLLDHFHHGVWVVELQAVTDPALVPSTLASTLGVEEVGDRSLTASLMAHLGDKELLLVLDNFEQVVEAAPLVGELLAGCSKLTVLVTSRIRLGLRGEREYPVPPLSLPDPRRLPSVAALSQYEAVRLFIERAQSVRPAFDVTNENAPAVAEICVRLDGLPLAIELAAARIRMLPPEAMLTRLKNRLPLLTGGARDLPVRQQTLRGAIIWSYDLLTPDEQALFRRLSVFAGGATLEAVEAVAAADELGLDVFAGMEHLVDHSLLRQTETAGEPRFGMLETIRAFGLEELERQGEGDEAQQRHAAYFLTLAEEAEPALLGPEQGLLLHRLETEHDNIRSALDWALAHEPETALRLGAALWRFWQIRSHLSEGHVWLERALAATPHVRTVARVRALDGAGFLAIVRGELSRAGSLLEESLVLAREIEDDFGIAMALGDLGNVALVSGDLERAEELFEEELAVVGEGEAWWYIRSSGLSSLGTLAQLRGDLERAAALFRDALGLFRERGDSFNTAISLVNLAETERARSDLREATGYYREALTLQQAIGDREGLAYSFAGLAGVAVENDDAARAARLAGAATGLCTAVGAVFEPFERAALDRTMHLARSRLGGEAFANAYGAGMALSLDAAIAEALAMTDRRSET